MATSQTGVPGIPSGALDAITDQNTRTVLQAIVDGWQVRNGVSGKGDNAFITRADLNNLGVSGVAGSLVNMQGGRKTSTSDSTFLKPGEISRIIHDLQVQVMESKLFKELGTRIDLIDTTTIANGNTITQEITDRANADNAIYTVVNSQFSRVDGSIAALQTTQTTTTNNVSALTSSVSTLQVTVGNNTAAIQTEATTRVNADNDIYSKYSVKIDQNGYVSGFGLISEANNSTPSSAFIVRADLFAIGSPSGPGISPQVPFIVLTTTDANGNPPGVYMDSVLIANAAIDEAKIADATITNAKIGDAQINTLKVAGNSITVSGQCTGTGWNYFYLNAPYGGTINIVAFNSGRSDGEADYLYVHVNGSVVNTFRGPVTTAYVTDGFTTGYMAPVSTASATEVNVVPVNGGYHQIAVYSSTYYRVLGLMTMR
jgi:hypothetical protein